MPRAGERRHKVTKRDGKTYIGRRHMRLGRRRERDDPRDYAYERPRRRPMTAATYKSWPDRTWRGDQNGWPECVVYTAAHRVENSPKTYPAPGPTFDLHTAYNRAQQLDEWPGENYDGTSTRAGARVMLELGLISRFERIATMSDLVSLVHTDGPTPIGVDWYDDMFSPVWKKDARGTYRWMLVPTGAIAGGHAVLLNGINIPARVFRVLNSWGTSWGDSGRAWISFEDVEQLVFGSGEAYRYVEVA